MDAIDGSAHLASVASRQHGLFALAQARSSGLSTSRLRRWVERGHYDRISPRVYAVAGVSSTWRRSVSAAVLTVGSGSAASHRTAAELWALTSFRSERIDVVTKRWDRVRRSFAVHESKDLENADVVVHDDIPVTTPHRTVVDLGATAPWLVESALETGVRRDLFTLDDVEGFVARVARWGRRGVGVIRPLIEMCRAWDGATDSELEDLFRRVPQPVTQFVLSDGSGGFVCRATSLTRTGASSSSPTAKPTTWIGSRFARIDRRRTRQARLAGRCCATRGETSTSVPPRSWPSSTDFSTYDPKSRFRRTSVPHAGTRYASSGRTRHHPGFRRTSVPHAGIRYASSERACGWAGAGRC